MLQSYNHKATCDTLNPKLPLNFWIVLFMLYNYDSDFVNSNAGETKTEDVVISFPAALYS